jgi:hypothetical protein
MKAVLIILLLCQLGHAQGVRFGMTRNEPFPLDSGVAISNAQYDAWQQQCAACQTTKAIIAQQRDLYSTQHQGCTAALLQSQLSNSTLQAQLATQQHKQPRRRGRKLLTIIAAAAVGLAIGANLQ